MALSQVVVAANNTTSSCRENTEEAESLEWR
jgi:hypothetical protein